MGLSAGSPGLRRRELPNGIPAIGGRRRRAPDVHGADDDARRHRQQRRSRPPGPDRVVAMADFGTGYVQIWNMRRNNATTLADDRRWGDDDDDDDDDDPDLGFDTAEPIARVDIADGGCCANVIWFD